MKLLTFTAAACLLASSTALADVQVSMHDGLVSVVARDATVRQILTEWARVGQTRVVNVEKIPGGPITLELVNVPEDQALDILLRSVSGYMAAPRTMKAANLSRFDRVVVMPTSAAPRAPVAAAPQQAPMFPQAPSQFGQAPFAQPPNFGQIADDDQDNDRAGTNPAVPNPRAPVFNTFPQPQIVNPQTGLPVNIPPIPQFPQQQPSATPQQPSATPSSPFGGVSVPGMMVPAPQQQPGQIGAPVQMPNPQQPRRPGGGQ